MPSSRLTERQNEAYEYILSYMRVQKKPPTLLEIGQALGIRSTNGVFKLLVALESKGYIRRDKHAARGLTLVDDPFVEEADVPLLPIVSRVSSAEPERLRRRFSRFLIADPRLLKGARDYEHFLVGRAGDDGMNRDGIRKGDYLVIEEVPQETLANDTVAAFLVRESLLVRRYYFVNGRIHLRPSDRSYTEETFPPSGPDCYVIGRVTGLLREM